MTQDRKDQDLAPFFEAARTATPPPSDALMGAILRDAAAMQPVPKKPPRRNLWAEMLSGLGGWPAMGALAVCAVVGFGIGAGESGAVSELASAYLSLDSDTDALMPGFDDFLVEG